MITLKLDDYLEKKLNVFAKNNNIEVEELIETVLYDYVDEIEEKNGPLMDTCPEEENYNPEDVSYLESALGFKKK